MSPDLDASPVEQEKAGPSPPPRVAPGPPSAKEEKSRWPGWIWAVPIAAVAIVAYLGFKQLAATGPEIAVIFPEAEGISANQTPVEYQGLKVGEVESVKLEKDLKHVRANIRMSSDMEGHLGPGTLFWIAGPSLTNLSSIRSVISGPNIGIEPRNGPKQSSYHGLAQAPAVQEIQPGRRYLLHTARLGNVSPRAPVYFHGMAVGRVEELSLNSDQTFTIPIFVREPYAKLVHDGTRFWSAGAVQMSMQGEGPRVQFQSLPSLLSGAIAFDTPSRAEAGREAGEDHVFKLYQDRQEAENAPSPDSVTYHVTFGPDAGGLKVGAPVKLAGSVVGSVQQANLEYDPATGRLSEQATISVDPSRITLAGGGSWPAGRREPVDAFIDRLIGEGLRARAGSAIPLVGPKDVELAFVQGAPVAALSTGSPPTLPTDAEGGGIQGVMTALNDIASKLDGVPLEQISNNIQTVTSRLAALSNSPQLTQSFDNLNRSLSNVEQLTASAKTDLPEVLSSLRHVASEAQRTVADAQHLISTTAGSGPMGMNQAGLSQTLYELSRAAESVRQLADYLDHHPSALIRGRG